MKVLDIYLVHGDINSNKAVIKIIHIKSYSIMEMQINGKIKSSKDLKKSDPATSLIIVIEKEHK